MPNGVPHDVYVIAAKQSNNSLPNETEIYDDRVFFTRENAVEALDDFPPYMRSNFEVYAAHLHISGISHDVPFVMPTDDVENTENSAGDTNSISSAESSDFERETLYNTCRQAIVDWCTNNRPALDAEFVTPLSDAQFAKACDLSNWMTSSEQDPALDPDEYDYDDVMGWCFNCLSFDDELCAYVRLDDQGNVTHIVVQGE